MTPREILLLKSSLVQLETSGALAADRFFARLFVLDVSLEDYFDSEQPGRRRYFAHVLASARQALNQPQSLAPLFRQYGRQLARVYVKESHYHTVGEALLWSLSQNLGNNFTPETRLAFGKFYWSLAEIMKAGARDGAANFQRAVA